jgi:glycosyltransferase involved in cell wall biosynthesis
MHDTPKYLFLKQSATLQSYFGELCLDIPRPGMAATVFSEIEEGQIGNIRFQTGPKYNRCSFGARVLSWAAYFGAASRFSFCVKGRPLLFIVAQPPFLPLIGYLQKKMLGRQYVVWIDDVYPDTLIRKGELRANGWVARLWMAFNRKTLGNSEHIFTLGPQMLEVVRQYLNAGFPATIIPTWVDTDVIHPVPMSENTWAKRLGLEDKFTIMYSGNFGETHELESLLEAASRLHARADLRFVLIGAGARWDSVRKSVAEHSHTNIIVLPWQPVEVLSESLSSADVSFVSLGEGIEGVSMPSKTYYAMAAGAAIMASCVYESDLGEVVRRSACGVIVRPNCVEDIVVAIQHLSSDPVKLKAFKENARYAAVNYYSRRMNAELVRETVERISESRGR